MAAVIAWVVVCLIWGTTWLFIKLGLRDLPPVSFAVLRSLVALIALGLLVAAQRRPLPRTRAQWRLLAISGFLTFSVNYGLLFWGAQFISSGLTAVLQATIPAFGLLIAHFYLPEERMTLARAGAVGLGLVGVAVIFSDQLTVAGWQAVVGCVAVVGGALAVAYANVMVKAFGREVDPAVLTSGQIAAGILPLLVVGLLTEGNPLTFHWTPRAVGALLYLALVGSATAFYLFYWLMRHMEVTKVMLTALVTPLLAVVLGAIVLGEALLWRTLIGGVLILASVGMALRRRPVPVLPVEKTAEAAALAAHP